MTSRLNRITENVVDIMAFGNEYTNATIQRAINAIGSDERTLLITPGTWVISSDITFPSNINLKFNRGGVLDIDSGKTVAINGGVEAGLWQIFDGAGVTFGSGVIQVYPEWWGAIANGTTD